MSNEDKKAKRIEINLNPETAKGAYANLEIVTHSPTEFILDFCQLFPGLPKANVISRLIVSPSHAKALLNTLSQNIAKYEENFGPIRELPRPQSPQLSISPDDKNNIPN